MTGDNFIFSQNLICAGSKPDTIFSTYDSPYLLEVLLQNAVENISLSLRPMVGENHIA
jgi:hypothetical protein